MPTGTLCSIVGVFLRLGLTSFGGPVAHLGYFRREVVARRGWLTEAGYAELVGLAQFLPGPASSQVCFAIGLVRGGYAGGVAAWTAFSLPSAIAMLLLAHGVESLTGPVAAHALHGLKLVAVPIVAQALVGMARTLAPDTPRRLMALAATLAMMLMAAPELQILLIGAGALAGLVLCRDGAAVAEALAGRVPARRAGLACLAAFALLLATLPLAARLAPVLAVIDLFYRTGALVFGGGHVVLPLLRAELVPHWMDDARFLAGYGAAQAMPGPLFTLGAYLGAVAVPGAPLLAGVAALVALSLPGLLLMAGALPFQAALRQSPRARGAVAGVNAAVIGLLAAALYDPLWTTAVLDWRDGAIVAVDLALLLWRRWPPLAIVAITVAASVLLR